jgi:hypothetical protein
MSDHEELDYEEEECNSRIYIDEPPAKEGKMLWKKFIEMTKKGDLEEVKKILLYDIELLHNRYYRGKELCPLCLAISNYQDEIMVELLDMDLEITGKCEVSYCTIVTSNKYKNKKAIIELVKRGWKWNSIHPGGRKKYEGEKNFTLDLLEEIIKDTFSPTENKPARDINISNEKKSI